MKFSEINIPKDELVEIIVENVNPHYNGEKWFIKNYEFLGYHEYYSLIDLFKDYLMKYEIEDFEPTELKTTNEKEMKCPLCGEIVNDSFELFNHGEYEGQTDCEKCGNTFEYNVDFEPKFSTFFGYNK